MSAQTLASRHKSWNKFGAKRAIIAIVIISIQLTVPDRAFCIFMPHESNTLMALCFGPGVLACTTRGSGRSEAGHCFHLLFFFSCFSTPSAFHPLRGYSGSFFIALIFWHNQKEYKKIYIFFFNLKSFFYKSGFSRDFSAFYGQLSVASPWSIFLISTTSCDIIPRYLKTQNENFLFDLIRMNLKTHKDFTSRCLMSKIEHCYTS